MTRAQRPGTPEVAPRMRSRRLAPSARTSVTKSKKPKWQVIPPKLAKKAAVKLRRRREFRQDLVGQIRELEVEGRSRLKSRYIRRSVRGSWLSSRCAWIALPTRGAPFGGR